MCKYNVGHATLDDQHATKSKRKLKETPANLRVAM